MKKGVQGERKQRRGKITLAALPMPTLLPQIEQTVKQDECLHSRCQKLPQGAECHHLMLLLQHGPHSP